MNSSTGSEDILRPLTSAELDELLTLYKNNYSKTDFQYISLYTQCKWNRRLEQLDASGEAPQWRPFRKQFYTHRRGNPANGTYVSLHWDLMLSVQFYTLEDSWTELKECLLKTQLIDWSSGPLVTGVFLETNELVMDILKAVGAEVDRARECHCMLLSPMHARQLQDPELPTGYSLRALLARDMEPIHSMWANKKEGSLDYVKGFAVINKTLGIVREKDDVLVGWIFQNEFSGLGILYVLAEEQRKGLGKLLAIRMSKAIASDEDVDISAFFVKGNKQSEALLRKIGFQLSSKTVWIQCKPMHNALDK